MRARTLIVAAALVGAARVASFQTPSPVVPEVRAAAPASQATVTSLGSDPNGNPLRKALKTGHVSNYDEAKLPPYTLPDPLVLANGQRVRTADTWLKQRRAEIVALYEADIFGRVPATAPKVTWEVGLTDPVARNGSAVMKRLVGHIGGNPGPKMNVTLYTPAKAVRPVPVILIVNFGGGAAAVGRAANIPVGDPPVAAEILDRGWGYATVGYEDIQPDRASAWKEGVIGASLAAGQDQPGPGEWGTISAWAWGVSRIVDYLETDKAIDPARIALQGFSRLGKTVLWAAAKDQRIKAVFSACGGEMGSALSRRDYGETVDDMAQNFPWWFAGAFQQWVGRWNDMPVDAHMLIALSAPRPVFITGGTGDQWADPKGEFLAEVAAGPVYRLLGKRDLGVTEFPAVETPIVSGDLGFNYHTGPHQVQPIEWKTFLEFLGKYFT